MIQLNTQNRPQTLLEAARYFDAETAEAFVASIKWPSGELCCPECGSINVGQIRSRRRFQCREKSCRRQFSVKHGTIFTESPLPLDKWLIGIWMIANCRNGVSSCEIARTLGIKQQSAWHLLHRVRAAMKFSHHARRLNGEVEADTTFVGGLFKNMHRERRLKAMSDFGGKGKIAVHAVLQRDGELRASIVRREDRKSTRSEVRRHVEHGSKLYTDAGSAYRWASDEYLHEWVNHALEYVRGTVHVNGLENFFSLLRRGLRGTYVAVEPKHLSAYIDEQAFRFNHRKESDWIRFDRLMHRIVGRRLTYSDLTGGKRR